MEQFTLEPLFEEYVEKRKLNISYEQFTSFAAFYPSLMVLHSDGRVDNDEWAYLSQLATGLVRVYQSRFKFEEEADELKQVFMDEFHYLLSTFDEWERKFITALKYHLGVHTKDKQVVNAALYLFAEASEGISEKEYIMIEHLQQQLNLNA
jgi:hypothetical protein